jgi:hypothetical protein
MGCPRTPLRAEVGGALEVESGGLPRKDGAYRLDLKLVDAKKACPNRKE